MSDCKKCEGPLLSMFDKMSGQCLFCDLKDMKTAKYKPMFEMHADGVKEVTEECPFCDEPCEQPHCPYTEEE